MNKYLRQGDSYQHFSITDGSAGIIYTRTGRRFFDDALMEASLLERLRNAMGSNGIWEELDSDWVCLDCELMPWSAKAQELLKQQYAAVGAAGTTALPAAVSALGMASNIPGIAELYERSQLRAAAAERYVESYRRYCWP